MGIFNILLHNSGQKARTLAPTQQQTPQGYRGVLEHDTSLCTGCGTCAYVCSPGAIHLERQQNGVLWEYLGVQCSFCARCVQFCPTGALQMVEQSPGALRAIPEDPARPLNTQHMVDYQPCERCGQPFVPMPAHVLARLSGREIETGMASLLRLCEKCRSRVASERIRNGLGGGAK